MTLADQVAGILRQHVGRENAIKSTRIAAELGISKDGRSVRHIIADEDWESREMLVVAIPGFGFYVANDISECNAYIAFLILLRDGLTAKIEKFSRTCAKQGLLIKK